MIQNFTQIEQYKHDNQTFYVKREDLACSPPGPPFAKVRGLFKVLEKLKEQKVDTVGYMETAVSMAGWGITYFCKQLGMHAVIYYPEYKDGYRFNQSMFIPKWKEFDGEVIPLEKPNLMQINAIRAKKLFDERFPNGVFFAPGLKFKETIFEVEREAKKAIEDLKPKTIVCAVGSGVMMTGVLRGIHSSGIKVNTILGVKVHRETNSEKKKEYILKLGNFGDGFFDIDLSKVTDSFEIVNGGYLYEEIPQIEKKFPCNSFYELKAYKYMIDHLKELEKPVLFWNIGA